MAYIGIQARPGLKLPDPSWLDRFLSAEQGPGYWDRACYRDADGYETLFTAAYWTDSAQFESWKQHSGFNAWWIADDRRDDPYGYFLEVYTPAVENLEMTIFSPPWRREGLAVLADSVTDDVIEHSYWGGLYDRIPSTQYDWLKPEGQPQSSSTLEEINNPRPGYCVRVMPAKNVAIIRSSQDWSKTKGVERDAYLNEIQPVLNEGMNFLRDKGEEAGCYDCRMVTLLDKTGEATEHTYGMAIFRSLDHMAVWASSHHTHQKLFGTFMEVLQRLNFVLDSMFYHEIAVMRADEQFYEYMNCHPRTGMLKSLGSGFQV